MSELTIALIIAGVSALSNIIGTYNNHVLSKKLKAADEDEKEKRELRRKIHYRLAEFEFDALPNLRYIKKIDDRLLYVEKNVKRYDPFLSDMIKKFRKDWKKAVPTFSSGKPLSELNVANLAVLLELSAFIGSMADDLLETSSIVETVKIRLRRLRMRIGFASLEWFPKLQEYLQKRFEKKTQQ